MIAPTLSKRNLVQKQYLVGRRLLIRDRFVPLRKWTWKSTPRAQLVKELVEVIALALIVSVFILWTVI